MSWSEFESELNNGEKVYSLDTLYEAHQRYLKKALFRFASLIERFETMTFIYA